MLNRRGGGFGCLSDAGCVYMFIVSCKSRSRSSPVQVALKGENSDLAHLQLVAVDTSVQDTLVRDKANAEVVLESSADDQLDDVGSPWDCVSVVTSVLAPVHGDENDLDNIEHEPDNGADKEHPDEAINPHWLFLVDTSETISRDEGNQDVEDTQDNQDSKVTTGVTTSENQDKSAVSVVDEHDSGDDHGTSVEREAEAAVLELRHLSDDTLTVTLDHMGFWCIGGSGVDNSGRSLLWNIVRLLWRCLRAIRLSQHWIRTRSELLDRCTNTGLIMLDRRAYNGLLVLLHGGAGRDELLARCTRNWLRLVGRCAGDRLRRDIVCWLSGIRWVVVGVLVCWRRGGHGVCSRVKRDEIGRAHV